MLSGNNKIIVGLLSTEFYSVYCMYRCPSVLVNQFKILLIINIRT